MGTLSKEEQILQMVKKVLTDVAKDTYTKPGLKHPLSENTILGIRDCLGLISARERELADAQGRAVEKPYYADEPRQAEVVPIGKIQKREKTDE